MIDSLNGEVIAIGLDHAVIECSGVGYRFLATPPTLGGLQRGEKRRVLTSMVVKDDGMTLYGFADADARTIFHKLQTVTGLGPKLALAALAVFQPGELASHIAAGDAKALQTIPGVGKKMADRMVLELKGKLEGFAVAPAQDQAPSAASGAGGASFASEQVVEALVGLGFVEKSARPVVEALQAEQPEIAQSALLRAALTQLGKK
ncbi:Holliday junction branch migration protein RuvA [Corynebacterium riegelii]|uniref:Holliday junction branch migration complex subunit RuvA n=1 Tax=Corynebacterium riegelii TaxID=156976 RepID=A0A0K1RA15_9CORY|nr:Holliday junction branch migration protein RuvA [Corynebacterium riegelii]AKV58267.1 ATP-dependent DNA helicase RuvA [Corynebacterium riegelii]